MKIHHLNVAEALQSLRSSPEGLASIEARRRLREFGPNQVERVKGTPLSHRFLKGFTHFFALILWVAAGLAFVAEARDPGSGMARLGWAILGVIFINGLFSFWQEHRAERTIAALEKLVPHQVKALRDAKAQQIPTEDLVPGDVILLDAGEDVPADCRVLEAFGLRVNTATVTGESLPKTRDAQPSKEGELTHSRNILLAGTSVVSGQVRALVFATGMHTEFGQIAHLTQTPRPPLSPLQKEIARLSRLVALLSIILGGICFGVGQFLGLSFWENFLFAIGIIVANVPEGLLPTVTLALAMGSQSMARRKALVRHLPSVETLGSATVICTDKTGTLTQNRMAVKRHLGRRPGHRYAAGPGAGGREATSPGHARAAPLLEGALAERIPSDSGLPLLGTPRSSGSDGCFLLPASRRRLAVQPDAAAGRPPVFAGHHRLLECHHRHAGDQSFSVSQRYRFRIHTWAFQQPVDSGRNWCRNHPDPPHRLHFGRKSPLRHGPYPWKGLAFRPSVCSGNAGPGRIT
jgi:magnesium-transporting ATPase (P-type)